MEDKKMNSKQPGKAAELKKSEYVKDKEKQAAGIVTKSELAGMDLKAEIKKEQLSVFLVRAIQLQDDAEALSDAELTFADSHTITASCRGSVAELAVLGIVKGDDENNFSPDLSVTRAVVATMISRSLDYLSSAGKTLVIDGYDGVIRRPDPRGAFDRRQRRCPRL